MKEMKLIVGNNDNTAAERYALHCEAISFTTSSSNMKKRSPFMKKVMTFNKKVKKNTGQLPMYLVQNHHEGIISRETFDAAQAELARRSAGKSPSKKNAPTGRGRYSSKYALSDRLYCGECGTRYQRCTWRNRGRSKRIVRRCVSRVDYGNKYCHDSPTLDEGYCQGLCAKKFADSG